VLCSIHTFAPLKLAFDCGADEIGALFALAQDSLDAVERSRRKPRRGLVLVYALAAHALFNPQN
jgi:hypothetical protein